MVGAVLLATILTFHTHLGAALDVRITGIRTTGQLATVEQLNLKVTDADGVATFRIVGTNANANPGYFEANLVDSNRFYQYGYSEILPIRFVRP